MYNDMYGNLPANRRRQFNFNRIRRVVNMISGHQRRNRKSSNVIAVENGDGDTADQFTKILMWNNRQENVLETISSAFEGALISGMNLLQVWVDFRSDPVAGNIKVDNCSYNSFLIDPFFKKKDLSDCNYIWKRSFITKRECISLMPDSADTIIGLVANDYGGSRDGKFQFMAESYNYSYNNLLTYDEYWYRDYREQKMLIDSQTGEVMEWKSNDNDRLRYFLQQYPQVTVVEQQVPTVKLGIVVQGKVLYDDVNPLGIDRYPFCPVWAYYRPEIPYFPWRVQGIVRNLRDSQYLYNRRRVTELDILESQLSSGYIAKESSLINPKDVFLQGQGRTIWLKDEAQMTDIIPIIPPAIPETTIQLSELLAKEIEQISGISEELLGFDNDQTFSGIHAKLKQSAGLTTLNGLFDNLDTAQVLLDTVRLEIIQNNFTPGKVKNILEGEKPTAEFYNKNFGKYHIAVSEGLNTDTQKQMNFAQLLQLKELGVPIPDDILIEQSTLQDKKKLVEAIQKQQQQAQQMQQQQAESAMQLQQAQIRVAESTAQANEGLGYERLSRVEENRALADEREAKAYHETKLATLEWIKTLKELESIDISHLKELISMAHAVEAMELAKKDANSMLTKDKVNNEVRGNNLAANGGMVSPSGL